MGYCKNCGESREVKDETGKVIGIIDLDHNGLCDDCADKRELAKVVQEEDKVYRDFDYSMNY